MAGGLKAVAYTNVFQMLLLIFVSATLTIAGLYKVGGVSALAEAVPADYWNLFRPNDDPAFPWLPIILGIPSWESGSGAQTNPWYSLYWLLRI